MSFRTYGSIFYSAALPIVRTTVPHAHMLGRCHHVGNNVMHECVQSMCVAVNSTLHLQCTADAPAGGKGDARLSWAFQRPDRGAWKTLRTKTRVSVWLMTGGRTN